MAVVVVAARRRGHWLVAARVWLAIDIVRLCATPGPLGPVDGGMGGCHWCHLIVFTAAASCGCGRWWVAARVWLVIDVTCLCATPGPLGPVDGGVGGCPWCRPIANVVVVVLGCGLWRVAAWSFHTIGVARFCAMRGVPLDAGGQ